jgi:hypothetical protein
MNDGDLGENITEHAEKADSQLSEPYRFANDEAHLEPRYTRKQTVAPNSGLTDEIAAGGLPHRHSP